MFWHRGNKVPRLKSTILSDFIDGGTYQCGGNTLVALFHLTRNAIPIMTGFEYKDKAAFDAVD